MNSVYAGKPAIFVFDPDSMAQVDFFDFNNFVYIINMFLFNILDLLKEQLKHIFKNLLSQVLRGENWLPIRPGFDVLYHYRNFYNQPKGGAPGLTGLISE